MEKLTVNIKLDNSAELIELLNKIKNQVELIELFNIIKNQVEELEKSLTQLENYGCNILIE